MRAGRDEAGAAATAWGSTVAVTAGEALAGSGSAFGISGGGFWLEQAAAQSQIPKSPPTREPLEIQADLPPSPVALLAGCMANLSSEPRALGAPSIRARIHPKGSGNGTRYADRH